MSKPTKRSVAVLVRRNGQILSVRRPADDDELPGIWGLPAGTCGEGESVSDVIQRIGREKLGVELRPLHLLRRGIQERPGYVLDMELWEAGLTGYPDYPEWQWASFEILRSGASSGSLCCELALRQKEEGRVSL
jgi:8-oxo-dGTP pyrophosphatase MutT (NUDIX family)